LAPPLPSDAFDSVKVLPSVSRCRRGVSTDRAILEPLTKAGIEATVFDEIESNPKNRNVEKGAAVAGEFGAEALVAIDGGALLTVPNPLLF
jgi:alcohol dehydrogenase class IV